MEEIILRVNDLKKQYRAKWFRKISALNGLSMTVRRGEIYGFVGENGSGKTTLMSIVTGRAFQNEGTMELFGKTEPKERIPELAKIGAVIESPALYRDMTVWNNLRAMAIMKGVDENSHIKEILDIIGLTSERETKAGKLSMGKKQRLGFGMALVGKPEFLILDEPTNGMDPRSMMEFRETIQRLNQEHGLTVLISSHMLSELDKFATCYGFIKDGKMVEEISARDLHNKCQTCTTIRTNKDCNTVIALMAKRYPDYFITKITKQTMLVFGYNGTEDEIKNLLSDSEVIVEEITIQEGSLESYYLYKMEDHDYSESKKNMGIHS